MVLTGRNKGGESGRALMCHLRPGRGKKARAVLLQLLLLLALLLLLLRLLLLLLLPLLLLPLLPLKVRALLAQLVRACRHRGALRPHRCLLHQQRCGLHRRLKGFGVGARQGAPHAPPVHELELGALKGGQGVAGGG